MEHLNTLNQSDKIVRISIDIETLSLLPNAALFDIGACVVGNPHNSFSGTINPNDLVFIDAYYSLSIDRNTLLFHETKNAKNWKLWNKLPGAENQDQAIANMINLMLDFGTWINDLKEEYPYNTKFEFWFNGCAFDAPVLEHMYRKLELPCPWKYGQVRDLRTVRELLGLPRPDSSTVAHTGIEDAIAQATVVDQCVKLIETLQTGYDKWQDNENECDDAGEYPG